MDAALAWTVVGSGAGVAVAAIVVQTRSAENRPKGHCGVGVRAIRAERSIVRRVCIRQDGAIAVRPPGRAVELPARRRHQSSSLHLQLRPRTIRDIVAAFELAWNRATPHADTIGLPRARYPRLNERRCGICGLYQRLSREFLMPPP